MSQTLHRLQGWLRRPIEFILTSTCLEDVCGLRFLSLLSLIYSIRISWVSMVIRPIPTQISPQELDPRRQYIFREHPITQLLLQWLVLLISRNEQWLKFSKEVMELLCLSLWIPTEPSKQANLMLFPVKETKHRERRWPAPLPHLHTQELWLLLLLPCSLWSTKPRQYVKKQSHHFADKGSCSQVYSLSSSHA